MAGTTRALSSRLLSEREDGSLLTTRSTDDLNDSGLPDVESFAGTEEDAADEEDYANLTQVRTISHDEAKLIAETVKQFAERMTFRRPIDKIADRFSALRKLDTLCGELLLEDYRRLQTAIAVKDAECERLQRASETKDAELEALKRSLEMAQKAGKKAAEENFALQQRNNQLLAQLQRANTEHAVAIEAANAERDQLVQRRRDQLQTEIQNLQRQLEQLPRIANAQTPALITGGRRLKLDANSRYHCFCGKFISPNTPNNCKGCGQLITSQ